MSSCCGSDSLDSLSAELLSFYCPKKQMWPDNCVRNSTGVRSYSMQLTNVHSSLRPSSAHVRAPVNRSTAHAGTPLRPHNSSCRHDRAFLVAATPNNQQTDPELERLRQQGGYNYPLPPRNQAPPPPPQQQQQQQPWGWPQQPPQHQQQQQQPWSWQQTQDPAAATQSGGAGKGGNGGGNNNGSNDGGGLSGYTKALIAAAFVTGLGAGVYFDAEINLSPNQVSCLLSAVLLLVTCIVARA